MQQTRSIVSDTIASLELSSNKISTSPQLLFLNTPSSSSPHTNFESWEKCKNNGRRLESSLTPRHVKLAVTASGQHKHGWGTGQVYTPQVTCSGPHTQAHHATHSPRNILINLALIKRCKCTRMVTKNNITYLPPTKLPNSLLAAMSVCWHTLRWCSNTTQILHDDIIY